MGYDAYSRVIVGAEVIRATNVETVTKYNPDTGEPMPKSVETEVLRFGDNEWELSSMWEEEKVGNNLKFFPTNCESNGKVYIGIALKRMTDKRELDETFQEVQDEFAALGDDGEPYLCKFLYESY